MTTQKSIAEMSQAEICIDLIRLQGLFTDADYNALEENLYLRAAVLGWTGDPLKQPPETVLAAARQVVAERRAREEDVEITGSGWNWDTRE
jgi:hypothetical protein